MKDMAQKTEARKTIESLVARFTENISQYKKTNYDEANTRVDFIDPFFEALGWDVANKQGYAEQYREVVREDKVIIVGKHKAPDYSFRIGGIRKFFVEAKKPSVDLKRDVTPAFQLRRYAYTAKLPLSILTDFEELSVYDTRIKPSVKDTASVSRIFYCNYKDYIKDFDFIFDSFSKEAILKGSFDRYVESTKNKRGTSEVDKEFLKLIDEWREKLAKNIAIRNKQLPLDELNFAVQKIIDRIIFLRIAEDRQIEDYGTLQILTNGANVYERLMQIFYHSDRRYNSGLFDFKKDRITPNLTVDDRVIKEIIKSVYYPDSPYEFSVFDVEILGNIYEQFLGKTIRLTPAHLVKVEEKPEVKKAGGVYYTPKYIVDYIVKNTVGELTKKKTPKQIEKIRILDPACGSGSFLLGAYQCLLDEHLNWYSKGEHYKRALKQGRIIQRGKDSYQLSVEEKQKILTNSIFGVDIDSQAVEVSKLSLLLKLLEGETEESTGKLFKYSQIKLLPDLSNNIKCGNSLIGTDYFEGRITGTIDEDEIRKINPFDWKKEFPEIFAQGGFDAVIGNPPYFLIALKNEKIYLKSNYELSTGKPDLYRYFIECSHQLIRKGGQFGFIIPNTLLAIPATKKLRKYLLYEGGLYKIVNFWGRVFEKASVNNIIIFTKKRTLPVSIEVIEDKSEIPSKESLDNFIKLKHLVEREVWLNDEQFKFSLSSTKEKVKIIEKIKNQSVGLSSSAKYTLGMQVYHNSKHTKTQIKERMYHSDVKKDETYYKESTGYNIQRYYFVNEFKKYVSYGDWCYNKPNWEFCSEPRILIREIPAKTLVCAFSNSTHIPTKAVIIVIATKVNLYYLMGILNSLLIGFYVQITGEKGSQRLFPRISLTTVRKLPIRTIDFSNPAEKSQHDKMVKMVDKMLRLQKKYHSTRLEHDKKLFKTQLDLLDQKIDSLVYELYGLTKKEITVVEGS